MKRSLMLILILIAALFSGGVLAQDTVPFTTSGGLTVEFPADLVPEEDGFLSIFATKDNETTGIGVQVLGADELAMFGGASVDAIYDFVVGFFSDSDTETLVGEPERITINGADAILQALDTDEFGESFLLVFVLDAELEFFGFALAFGEITADQLIAAAESAVVDPELAVIDPFDTDFEFDFETDPTDTVIPAGRIAVSDLPEGVLLLYNTEGGSQLTFNADNWDVYADDVPYIENTATLLFDAGFGNTITITDNGRDILGVDFYIDFIIPTLAGLGGDEDFSEDHIELVELADGRIAYVYDSQMIVEEGASMFGVIVYLVPVDGTDDHLGYIQAIITDLSVLEDIRLDVFDIASSFIPRDGTYDDLIGTGNASKPPFVDAITLADFSLTEDDLTEVTCTAQSRNVISESAPTAFVVCPSGCAAAAVWGTDTYTSDSSICTAAKHAGVDTEGGQSFVIQYAEGMGEYTGSERNGVSTRNWGSYGSSFVVHVLGESKPVENVSATVNLASLNLTPDDVEVLTCGDMSRNIISESEPVALVACPADCGSSSIWGTDVYTDDSSVCSAALHAGVIDSSGGLPFVIKYVEGQDEYIASERNGISSGSWGSWSSSFSVFGVE